MGVRHVRSSHMYGGQNVVLKPAWSTVSTLWQLNSADHDSGRRALPSLTGPHPIMAPSASPCLCDIFDAQSELFALCWAA